MKISLHSSEQTQPGYKKHSNIHVFDVCKFVESTGYICISENYSFVMHNNGYAPSSQIFKASDRFMNI